MEKNETKHYCMADAPDRLTAEVSLPLITAHLITAAITTTILELLSQQYRQ